jgi:hypothetical protein
MGTIQHIHRAVMFYERDEYAEKHRYAPGWGLALVWIAANTLNIVVATPLGASIEQSISPSPFVSIIAAGLATGAIFGFTQGLVLLPYMGARAAGEWIAVTIIGRTLRRLFMSTVGIALLTAPKIPPQGETFEALINARIADDLVLVAILIIVGGVAGALLGLTQQVVLMRRVHHSWWWVLANTASSLTTLIIVYLYEDVGVVVSSVIGGTITAIALIGLLQHQKGKATWYLPPGPKRVDVPSSGDTQPSPEELLERLKREGKAQGQSQ